MLDEFEDFCTMSGVLNDLFTAPIVSHTYNISLFTHEDEIKTGNHLRASLVEFLEMICRIAHEGSYPPPPELDEDGEECDIEMSVEERKA